MSLHSACWSHSMFSSSHQLVLVLVLVIGLHQVMVVVVFIYADSSSHVMLLLHGSVLGTRVQRTERNTVGE